MASDNIGNPINENNLKNQEQLSAADAARDKVADNLAEWLVSLRQTLSPSEFGALGNLKELAVGVAMGDKHAREELLKIYRNAEMVKNTFDQKSVDGGEKAEILSKLMHDLNESQGVLARDSVFLDPELASLQEFGPDEVRMGKELAKQSETDVRDFSDSFPADASPAEHPESQSLVKEAEGARDSLLHELARSTSQANDAVTTESGTGAVSGVAETQQLIIEKTKPVAEDAEADVKKTLQRTLGSAQEWLNREYVNLSPGQKKSPQAEALLQAASDAAIKKFAATGEFAYKQIPITTAMGARRVLHEGLNVLPVLEQLRLVQRQIEAKPNPEQLDRDILYAAKMWADTLTANSKIYLEKHFGKESLESLTPDETDLLEKRIDHELAARGVEVQGKAAEKMREHVREEILQMIELDVPIVFSKVEKPVEKKQEETTRAEVPATEAAAEVPAQEHEAEPLSQKLSEIFNLITDERKHFRPQDSARIDADSASLQRRLEAGDFFAYDPGTKEEPSFSDSIYNTLRGYQEKLAERIALYERTQFDPQGAEQNKELLSKIENILPEIEAKKPVAHREQVSEAAPPALAEKAETQNTEALKREYDPIFMLLRDVVGIAPQDMPTYSYQTIEGIEQSREGETARYKQFSNLHDLVEYRRSLEPEVRREFDLFSREHRTVPVAVVLGKDFGERIADEKDPLQKYQGRIFNLMREIRDERMPDAYAEAVASGKIKPDELVEIAGVQAQPVVESVAATSDSQGTSSEVLPEQQERQEDPYEKISPTISEAFEKDSLHYKEEKLQRDPLYRFAKDVMKLEGKDLPDFYYRAVEAIVPGKDGNEGQFKDIYNYHDLIQYRRNLLKLGKRDAFDEVAWPDGWKKMDIRANELFWKQINSSDHPYNTHRDELYGLIEKITNEELPDEYAFAVKRGEVMPEEEKNGKPEMVKENDQPEVAEQEVRLDPAEAREKEITAIQTELDALDLSIEASLAYLEDAQSTGQDTAKIQSELAALKRRQMDYQKNLDALTREAMQDKVIEVVDSKEEAREIIEDAVVDVPIVEAEAEETPALAAAREAYALALHKQKKFFSGKGSKEKLEEARTAYELALHESFSKKLSGAETLTENEQLALVADLAVNKIKERDELMGAFRELEEGTFGSGFKKFWKRHAKLRLAVGIGLTASGVVMAASNLPVAAAIIATRAALSGVGTAMSVEATWEKVKNNFGKGGNKRVLLEKPFSSEGYESVKSLSIEELEELFAAQSLDAATNNLERGSRKTWLRGRTVEHESAKAVEDELRRRWAENLQTEFASRAARGEHVDVNIAEVLTQALGSEKFARTKLEKQNLDNRSNAIKKWSAAAAAGITVGWLVGSKGDYIHDALMGKTVKDAGKGAVEVGQSTADVDTKSGFDKIVEAKPDQKGLVYDKLHKPHIVESEAPKVPPPDVKPTADVHAAEVVVKKGDSVWKIIDQELGKRLDNYGSMSEAQKTYIIDSLKDKVVANPKAFGIENPELITPGQKIDLTSLFETKATVAKAAKAAASLSKEQLEHIDSLRSAASTAAKSAVESSAPDLGVTTHDAGTVAQEGKAFFKEASLDADDAATTAGRGIATVGSEDLTYNSESALTWPKGMDAFRQSTESSATNETAIIVEKAGKAFERIGKLTDRLPDTTVDRIADIKVGDFMKRGIVPKLEVMEGVTHNAAEKIAKAVKEIIKHADKAHGTKISRDWTLGILSNTVKVVEKAK